MKTFTWDISADSSETTDLNTTITAFGDGYEQAVSFGINNSRKSWQCSRTDKKAVIDEIYRFLIDTKGVEPLAIRLMAYKGRYQPFADCMMILQGLSLL